jgi:hypothetical protein
MVAPVRKILDTPSYIQWRPVEIQTPIHRNLTGRSMNARVIAQQYSFVALITLNFYLGREEFGTRCKNGVLLFA